MICTACLKTETDKTLPAETYERFGLEPLALNICQTCQLDIGRAGTITGTGWAWLMRKVEEQKGGVTDEPATNTDD